MLKQFILFFGFVHFFIFGNAQTSVYKQFWNELAVMHPFQSKLAAEIALSTSFSDTPQNPRLLSTYTQFSAVTALHYYYSAKINYSFYASYFSNKFVPEIGQREYPELRLSAQGIYFFKKIGYILQSRTRLECRFIENSVQDIENVFRLRQRIKYTKPFNSKYIREKTYYGIILDEVFIKNPSTITGSQIFDRNELTGGLGYAFTDNFTCDLLYTFQYLPRSSGNEIYHAIQLNVQFTNPFINLKGKLNRKDPK